MGRRDDTSRGVKVHKAVGLARGGNLTACGRVYVRPGQTSTGWKDVTCKQCLRTRERKVR